MTVESLNCALNAVPFRPFTMHLAGGQVAHVPEQRFVTPHPETPQVVVVFDQAGGVNVIDLLLVNALSFGSPELHCCTS